MLEKFTPEQEKLMYEVRDEWIQTALHPKFNEEKVVAGVKWLYKLAKQKEPEVHIVPSIKAVQLKCAEITGKKEYYSYSVTDAWIDASWVAFYDYFHRIGVVNSPDFLKYKELLQAGLSLNVMMEGHAVVSKPPIVIKQDERRRLSSLDGPAIAWEDGYGQHYINGVFFSTSLYNKGILNKTMSGKDILAVRNAEQKAILIRVNGYEKIISELNPTILETDKLGQQLLEYDAGDGLIARVVRCKDTSTDRWFILGVPREGGTKTIQGALAWTFGETADSYKLDAES